MELDAITPDILKIALHAWQQAKNRVPLELLELHILADISISSPVERSLALHKYVYSCAVETLKRFQQAEDLSPINISNPSRKDLLESIAADFRCENEKLEAWSALYHRYLSPIPLDQGILAKASNVHPRQFRRRVSSGLDHLVILLRQAEMEAHTRLQTLYLHRHLPPPDYAKTFGIEPLIQKLVSLLIDPQGPRFVSIEGLGGIGKTTLAQVTAYRLAEQGYLEGILWVSTRQEFLSGRGELERVDNPVRSIDEIITRLAEQLGQEQLTGLSTSDKSEQLAPILSTIPYLVIIDNLETIEDTRDLISSIYSFAGETRFLLTSRYTIHHDQVHILQVPELSLTSSQALVKSELARRNRVGSLSEAGMKQIYKIIGGLPLALKLVVAQMGSAPLTNILNDLQRVRHQIPEMYTYIYRRTWLLLDDSARELLLSMLTVSPEGETVKWIQLMSSLPDSQFEGALSQLLDYSLLEVTGASLEDPIYHLHRLTWTFLHTDILLDDWADSIEENS